MIAPASHLASRARDRRRLAADTLRLDLLYGGDHENTPRPGASHSAALGRRGAPGNPPQCGIRHEVGIVTRRRALPACGRDTLTPLPGLCPRAVPDRGRGKFHKRKDLTAETSCWFKASCYVRRFRCRCRAGGRCLGCRVKVASDRRSNVVWTAGVSRHRPPPSEPPQTQTYQSIMAIHPEGSFWQNGVTVQARAH